MCDSPRRCQQVIFLKNHQGNLNQQKSFNNVIADCVSAAFLN